MKKNIAVLYGGYSSEHDISVQSGKFIASIIDKNLFNVYTVHISKKAWLVDEKYPIDKSDFSFQINSKKIHFHAAVILIHGTPGEDGLLQAYFNLIGLPFIACNPLAAILTFNKYYCNHYLENLGIKIAKSLIIRKNEQINPTEIAYSLGLPIFVKPNAGGSSFGTTKVKSIEQIKPAIEKARKESDEVIIEQFIKGREITVGVLKLNDKIHVLTPCEVRSKKEFFDYEAKYNPELNEEIIPAPIDPTLLHEVQNISQTIYRHLNCSGIIRIDYILSEADQKFYFLELNSIPGMTSASIVPKMLKYDNFNITEVYTKLILSALGD
jgi:D-alanine-D-alanine ligase